MTLATSAPVSQPTRTPSAPLRERFWYDDDIVRKFLFALLWWGVVGMLVGPLITLRLANPFFICHTPCLSFGRLRPLHTNAVIFTFAGNATPPWGKTLKPEQVGTVVAYVSTLQSTTPANPNAPHRVQAAP